MSIFLADTAVIQEKFIDLQLMTPQERNSVMMADVEMKVGESLAPLEFVARLDGDHLIISCNRTSDYYLELALWVVLCALSVMVGFYPMSAVLYGSASPVLFGLITMAVFIVAGMIFCKALVHLRDGYRRIIFSPSEGKVQVLRCSLFGLLGSNESFSFSQAEGFRIAPFISRRNSLRTPSEFFAVDLILKDGQAVTIYPLISNFEEAGDAVRQLTLLTGINQI